MVEVQAGLLHGLACDYSLKAGHVASVQCYPCRSEPAVAGVAVSPKVVPVGITCTEHLRAKPSSGTLLSGG